MNINLNYKPIRFRNYTKKWTISEEFDILDYLKKVIKDKLEIEKPCARIFYEKMLNELKWSDVSVSQIKNKVRHLKHSYIKAAKLRNNQTNWEANSTSARDQILAICLHWDNLDEIYGPTVDNISAPPYVYVSCNDDGDDDVDNAIEVKIEEIEHPIKIFKRSSSISNTIPRSRTPSDSSSTLSESPIILKYGNEAQPKQNDIDLSREKFEFDKEIRKKQIELEYRRIESQEKIRILELEKEERIEKLKLEYDFKLQLEYAKFSKN